MSAREKQLMFAAVASNDECFLAVYRVSCHSYLSFYPSLDFTSPSPAVCYLVISYPYVVAHFPLQVCCRIDNYLEKERGERGINNSPFTRMLLTKDEERKRG